MTYLMKIFAINIFIILPISVSNAASIKEPDTLIIGENHIEIESGNNLDGYHDIILGKELESQIITGKLYIPNYCLS